MRVAMVSRMQDYDPKLLRKLAANYRARAQTEPEMASTFREIARGMEARADELDGGRLATPPFAPTAELRH